MSFKNISFITLATLLFIYWIQRENASVEKASSSLIKNERSADKVVNEFYVAKADQIEPTSTPKGSKLDCPFPIQHDLDGASYNLALYSSVSSTELTSKLSSSISSLSHTYSRWLNTDVFDGIQLDLNIMLEHEFNAYLTGKVANPKAYLGVFLPADNLAVVKYINEDQVLSTAAHELTHAINFAIFGPLPRFINEGLAEYAEREVTQGKSSKFKVPEGMSKSLARAELLDFYSLMHSEQDWHTTNNTSLYLSGSAWAHFLMTSELGLEAMKKMLQLKFNSPCEELNPDQIISILATTYPNFEQDFYYWFDES